MFKIFKKLFVKNQIPVEVVLPVEAVPVAPVHSESAPALGKVETLSLSLAAIVAHFPEDLAATVVKVPDSQVMVALPLSTVLKQLPLGAVKMSMASIFRQAPGGTFTGVRVEEKRMVDVPLVEVLRRLNLNALRRRNDQRLHELAHGESFDLFSEPLNRISDPADGPVPAPMPSMIAGPAPLQMPSMGLGTSPASEPETVSASIPGLIPPLNRAPQPEPMRTVPPPPGFATIGAPAGVRPVDAAKPAEVAPKKTGVAESDQAPLVLPVSELCGGWPEAVLAEMAALFPGNATVALPAGPVGAGLGKGKVNFPWGDFRRWVIPAVAAPAQAPEETLLALPLRVLAPAFLKHTKSGASRKRLTIDESIPALFGGGPPKKESSFLPAAPAEVKLEFAPAPQAAQSVPEISIAPEPQEPRTVGEIFGKADKESWSPGEIVRELVGLPNVAGAIIALEEGLVVAESLPDFMKGEVVAAFLPQVFSRLNLYSGEMNLGQIDDLLLRTHGSYFQIYRLGLVFFAVLGEKGQNLPLSQLQVIAEELARHAQN
jgi:predicted regulator of Ras-like GTPase activity (Roadblock/LC7/MglB family)